MSLPTNYIRIITAMGHSILYQHPPPPIEGQGNPRGREGTFSSNF